MIYNLPNYHSITANVFNASIIPINALASTKEGLKTLAFLHFVTEDFVIRFPDGTDFHPNAGTVCYIPAKYPFALSGGDPSNLICITASGSLCDAFASACAAITPKLTLRPTAIEAFNALKDILETVVKTNEYINRVASHSYTLLVETFFAPEYAVERKPAIIAQRIKGYIENNIREDITVASIARDFYLSETHVIRIFREKFSETPKQYILRRKIEETKKMLLETTLQIKEIAMIFNFADSYHFSHTFKRLTGYSPERFRMREAIRKKQLREQNNE